MTTEPDIATRVSKSGGRAWPGWLKVAIAVVAILMIGLLLLLLTEMTTGGPSYPWDRFLGGVRGAVRVVWAAVTGQSLQQDLFP